MSDGHGHGHGAAAGADQSWLTGSLAVIVAFMAGEVVVGVLAGSLALLSDAAHMLTDAGSIALAIWVGRLSIRPATGRMTYGWKRAEVLSAQANGLTLLLLAVWLAYESVLRLLSPPEVFGAPVLGTALVGIAVNLAATWMLSRANRTSLSVEGAFQHILTDLFAFLATAAAGLVMVLTGYTRADPIASLVVVALMVRAGVALVRESSRIFLEAAPAGLDPAEIGAVMARRAHVSEVHDLHIWEITSGQPALSAHVLVDPGQNCHDVRGELAALLAAEHHIEHVTLQVDHANPAVLEITGEIPGEHCHDSHGPVHRRGTAEESAR